MAAAKTPKPNVPVQPELTAQDCHNIVQLLNRVTTEGIQEAQVLLHVCGKVARIKEALDPNFGTQDGEDTPSA